MAWCDEDYDALHNEAMVTTDPDEREQLYVEMQQIWDEAAHTIFTTHGARPYAYVTSVAPATTPNGFPQISYFQPAE
jgi:ABC-type transport system substrate-binding protein